MMAASTRVATMPIAADCLGVWVYMPKTVTSASNTSTRPRSCGPTAV